MNDYLHLRQLIGYLWKEVQSLLQDSPDACLIVDDSEKSKKHALFTRKIDIHVDIAETIREVATWCGDNLKKLAARYYITTSVSQVDAGSLAGLRMNKAKGRKPRCVALQYWTKQVLVKLQEVFAIYRPIEPNRDYWKERINKGELDPVVA